MMIVLFTLAAFLIMTGVAISGYFFLTADSPVEERLRHVVPESALARPVAQRQRRELGPIGRLLTAIGSLTAGNNDKSLSKLLTTAGYRGTNALFLFVGIRTIVSMGPALLYLVPRISRGESFGR